MCLIADEQPFTEDPPKISESEKHMQSKHFLISNFINEWIYFIATDVQNQSFNTNILSCPFCSDLPTSSTVRLYIILHLRVIFNIHL